MLPSAYRPAVKLQISEYRFDVGPFERIFDQCSAEFFTLEKFFVIASRHGLRLPEDSYFLRTHLEQWRAEFLTTMPAPERKWPSPELFSLIALAQHYGIPTRALDWTASAFVAAYFAANAALTGRGGDRIAVWAIDDLARQIEREHDTSSEWPLVTFTVSAADNDNLRSQRGLFMIHSQSLVDVQEKFVPEPYDHIFRKTPFGGRTDVIRVLVAASEARNVLSLLGSAGVTAGALFPGLWGAAREYQEEQIVSPGQLPILRARTIRTVRQRVRVISDKRGA
jgi:hypothetical protein